jgi:hypothetical protein
MAAVTYNIDTTLTIYHSDANKSDAIGLDSIYNTKAHPITKNKIEGWKWDETVWPSPEEINNVDFVPTIFDATESGISNHYSINGIGDNDDLKLLEVSGEEGVWTPIINHGYFYIDNQEWYLLGDGYHSQVIPFDSLMSGLQFEALDFNPKPTIPVLVKSYEWNRHLKSYRINRAFRRKVEFTGTLVSGEELSTVNDEGIIELENIDTTDPEYVTLGTRDEGRVIYLNGDYSQQIGDNSTFNTLEFIYSGEDRNVYHTQFSPIDITTDFELWVDSGSYNPEEWTLIDDNTVFGGDGAKEYKLDPILGQVSFGNIWTGSGVVPLEDWVVGVSYTKSVLIEYEKENGADTIHADVQTENPNHPSANGFLEVDI